MAHRHHGCGQQTAEATKVANARGDEIRSGIRAGIEIEDERQRPKSDIVLVIDLDDRSREIVFDQYTGLVVMGKGGVRCENSKNLPPSGGM